MCTPVIANCRRSYRTRLTADHIREVCAAHANVQLPCPTIGRTNERPAARTRYSIGLSNHRLLPVRSGPRRDKCSPRAMCRLAAAWIGVTRSLRPFVGRVDLPRPGSSPDHVTRRNASELETRIAARRDQRLLGCSYVETISVREGILHRDGEPRWIRPSHR